MSVQSPKTTSVQVAGSGTGTMAMPDRIQSKLAGHGRRVGSNCSLVSTNGTLWSGYGGWRYDPSGPSVQTAGTALEGLAASAEAAVTGSAFAGLTIAAITSPARVKPIVRSAIWARTKSPGKPYQFQ